MEIDQHECALFELPLCTPHSTKMLLSRFPSLASWMGRGVTADPDACATSLGRSTTLGEFVAVHGDASSENGQMTVSTRSL